MAIAVVGAFKDARVTQLSQRHLLALDPASRELVHQELERLRRAGPMNIYRELLAFKPIGFVDGLKSVGFFLAGKVLGVLEVLRKRIQLVAAIDLQWLRTRPPEVFGMWKREALHKDYYWRAQVVLDSANHVTFIQVVCRAENVNAPSRKVKAWGYRVFWGEEHECIDLGSYLQHRQSSVEEKPGSIGQENYRTACAALNSLVRAEVHARAHAH